MHRDEDAFTALVERHGPMVLRLCRQVLGDEHEAQDAAQAVFLVLARRAGSIRRQDSVASWLYRVARRIAIRARVVAARRREIEWRKAQMDTPAGRRRSTIRPPDRALRGAGPARRAVPGAAGPLLPRGPDPRAGRPAAPMSRSDRRDALAARPCPPSRTIDPSRGGPVGGAGRCHTIGSGRIAGGMDRRRPFGPESLSTQVMRLPSGWSRRRPLPWQKESSESCSSRSLDWLPSRSMILGGLAVGGGVWASQGCEPGGSGRCSADDLTTRRVGAGIHATPTPSPTASGRPANPERLEG